MGLYVSLEILRSYIGADPIIITSGYRCEKHNAEVGGVANSMHMTGKAADIYVKGLSPKKLAQYARETNCFGYVKVYTNHVHVDVRNRR